MSPRSNGEGPGLNPRDSRFPESVWGRGRRRPEARRTILAGVLVALGAAVLPIPAAGGESSVEDFTALNLEELMQVRIPIVYGASKREQLATEAPASVSIVTGDDVKKYGYRTLADILRSVRGFYVTSDRSYSYIGVRGVNRPGDYGGRVLIMIDGHRVNEPVYDQAFNGQEFPVDVDLIERVEIIRGPGSSLYGNNAFFTVVNVVTRRGREVGGAEVAGAVASYDTYSGRLTYGNRFESGLEILLSGTLLDSAGHERLVYPEFNSVNGGVAEDLDGENARKMFASVSYLDLTLSGVFGVRTKDVPTAAYGTMFNEAPNQLSDERGYLELKYQREFAPGWLAKGRAYFDHYQYDALQPFDAMDPLRPGARVMNVDHARAHSWGGELQVSKTLFEKHRLTLGSEFRDDIELTQLNYDVEPPATYIDLSVNSGNYGLYLQDEYSIRTNLTLNAGVRYDHFSSIGGTVNPRAAVIYSPIRGTTLKFLYGQAYRAPNAYESDYEAAGYRSNEHLNPERIRSFETVWEQELTSHLRLTGAVFYNQIHDLITQQVDPADGAFVFQNTDAMDVVGGEAELEGQWAGALRGRVSYAYTDTRDRVSGRPLNNSPRHLAKLNLSVPLWAEKVFGSVEVQAMSSRSTVSGQETGAVWLMNFTLFTRELVHGLEFSASIYNLLDFSYADPVSVDFQQEAIEQDGRSFRLKLAYRF